MSREMNSDAVQCRDLRDRSKVIELKDAAMLHFKPTPSPRPEAAKLPTREPITVTAAERRDDAAQKLADAQKAQADRLERYREGNTFLAENTFNESDRHPLEMEKGPSR